MTRPTSNLGVGSLTVKYLVFIFNLVFFIAGLALIIIGAVTQAFFKEYIQFFDDEFKTPAIGIIILGIIILFISFFGCCGAKMENVCMLRTFTFLLGLLLICEIAAGISIAILKSDIEEVVARSMKQSMNSYNNSTLSQQTWDDTQRNLHCCGTDNYTDWFATPWNNNNTENVPDSCCKLFTSDCGHDAFKNHDSIYENGCADALKEAALGNLGAIIGGAVGLAIIQIIGILMATCLIRAVKEHYEVL